jgi:hypothetical protein
MGLAARASPAPLVAVGEPDEPWRLHHPFEELQHVRRRAVHPGQEADVQVAPAHQPGEVAAGQQHRADVGEPATTPAYVVVRMVGVLLWCYRSAW